MGKDVGRWGIGMGSWITLFEGGTRWGGTRAPSMAMAEELSFIRERALMCAVLLLRARE